MEKKTNIIDAKDKVLGRLAVEVCNLLRGRNKPGFLRYKDTGEEVVVFNTDKIKVSGKKMKQKIYYRHSGYLGGLRANPLEKMLEKDSREVFRKAVFGMMPKNKLRNQMIKKLKMFKREIEK
jgi:large subunit ribosomal protein L13